MSSDKLAPHAEDLRAISAGALEVVDEGADIDNEEVDQVSDRTQALSFNALTFEGDPLAMWHHAHPNNPNMPSTAQHRLMKTDAAFASEFVDRFLQTDPAKTNSEIICLLLSVTVHPEVLDKLVQELIKRDLGEVQIDRAIHLLKWNEESLLLFLSHCSAKYSNLRAFRYINIGFSPACELILIEHFTKQRRALQEDKDLLLLMASKDNKHIEGTGLIVLDFLKKNPTTSAVRSLFLDADHARNLLKLCASSSHSKAIGTLLAKTLSLQDLSKGDIKVLLATCDYSNVPDFVPSLTKSFLNLKPDLSDLESILRYPAVFSSLDAVETLMPRLLRPDFLNPERSHFARQYEFMPINAEETRIAGLSSNLPPIPKAMLLAHHGIPYDSLTNHYDTFRIAVELGCTDFKVIKYYQDALTAHNSAVSKYLGDLDDDE